MVSDPICFFAFCFVIGAVMRKLAHFIDGVIKSGKPFDLKKAMPTLDFQDGN